MLRHKIIEKRAKEIKKTGVSSMAFARKLAKAEHTRCPFCKRKGKIWSHAACGVMIDCKCGGRFGLSDWLNGTGYLMLQENGTYSHYVDGDI